jgi:prevent-host-death family protein
MRVVNMHEAKTQLSKLVAAVESGAEDEVVIARNGKPAVKIILAGGKPKTGGMKLGLARGRFTVPADFDDLDVEVARLINDGPLFPVG